jgi:hypothetical protein
MKLIHPLTSESKLLAIRANNTTQAQRWLLALSAAVFFLVGVILLTSPGAFFAPAISYIGPDLNKASNTDLAIRTRTNFGSPEYMANFPLKIGNWNGRDYNAEKVEGLLGADIVLLRRYSAGFFIEPMFFTLVQSRTQSSLHPPKVCFSGQGYKVQEEGLVNFEIKNAGWLDGKSNLSTAWNKLVVAKYLKDGSLKERQLVLYTFIKNNQFTSDEVNLVEVSALIAADGDYTGTLNQEKDFLTLAMPLMFEPQKERKFEPLAVKMAGWGAGGYLAVMALVLLPLGLIGYALKFRRKH